MLWWRAIVEPEGWIYVDSPEVYTRERLINERLDEDIWLAARLKEADNDENLAGMKRLLERRLELGTSGNKTENDSTAQRAAEATTVTADSSTKEEISLTFDQKVRLKSANRDFILKRIIENRLDDRHDLEGNSLYILKFDTTVITNQLSSKRAMVEVHINPPVAFPEDDEADPDSDMPLDIALSDDNSLNFIRHSFRQFINDTSDRLNNAIAKAHANFTIDPECIRTMQKCIQKYAALSFGVGEKDIVVREQEQGYEYRDVQKQTSGDAAAGAFTELTVSIDPLADYIRFANLSKTSLAAQPAEPPVVSPSEEQFQFDLKTKGCGETKETGRYAVPISSDELKARSPRTAGYLRAKPVQLVIDVNYYNLTESANRGKLFDVIEAAFPSDGSGNSQGFRAGQSASKPWGYLRFVETNETGAGSPQQETCLSISGSVNIGFLKFAQKMRQYNTYSYSVLPRENVVSAVDEIVESSSIRLGDPKDGTTWGGLFGISATTGDTSTSASLQARVTSFGYVPSPAVRGGSRRSEESRAVVVGWVINPMAARVKRKEDDLVSTTESVMAIVSVPSWWPYLDICVERHWLSTNGSRSGDETCSAQTGIQSTRIRVDLPNTQQLIESSLIGQERRTPRIETIRCEWGTETTAADAPSVKRRPLRCVVTGKRLWRNTVVTLGTQRHDNLSVMPNMEGLIVEFNNPLNQGCDGVTMSVWTSEGVAQKVAGAGMTDNARPPDFSCALPKGPDPEVSPPGANVVEAKP